MFPTGDRAELVDWVDYTQRNASADAAAFAQRALDEAGPERSVWLVSANDYSGGYEGKCEQIAAVLGGGAPGLVRAGGAERLDLRSHGAHPVRGPA